MMRIVRIAKEAIRKQSQATNLMKTTPEIYKASHAALSGAVTSLNAIIEQLPEAAREKLNGTRKSLEASVKELPDPADVKEDTSLNSVVESLCGAQDAVLGVNRELQEAIKGQKVSLNKLAELEGRIESGELVTKEKLTADVTAARTAGETAATEKFRLAGTRREALAKCGLPSPADELLAGDEKAFNDAKAIADRRAAELKAKGITSLNGSIGASLWASEDAYQRDLKLVEEFRGKSGANPFAGGGGKPEGIGYAGAV